MAKPFYDMILAREPNNFEDPIEWVAAPTSVVRLFLSPFIDQRERDSEFSSDCLGARFLEGLLKDLVRIHGLILAKSYR